MFNIKIFCYHRYDKFKPSIIGKTGRSAEELLQWAGKKVFPIVFQSTSYGEGFVDVVLYDHWGDEIAEKSFRF